jgi:hypothetical protein
VTVDHANDVLVDDRQDLFGRDLAAPSRELLLAAAGDPFERRGSRAIDIAHVLATQTEHQLPYAEEEQVSDTEHVAVV